MTLMPSWADYEYAERTAAAMARNLSGPSESWGTLLATAQAVLAYRTDERRSERQDSYEFKEWKDLVASARILDLAASEMGIKDVDSRRSAAILAACAFGMSGTSVSASAVIQRHLLLKGNLSPGELTALTISSPSISDALYAELPTDSPHRSCIEQLTGFLATGEERFFIAAANLLEEALRHETGVWEAYLLRISRLSLSHVHRLSTAKLLMQYEHSFPSTYLDKLVADSPLLLPSQFEALKNRGLLDSDKNLLVALPTGTGKTLLGELALMHALGRQPGLVCYIAPYVALGRQVYEKLHRHSPPEVRVHQLLGGYKEPEPLDAAGYPEVVVATPERFDALLRTHPELLAAVQCVVFDEAHLIGNDQRGIRLEGILTRLRLAKARGKSVPRFVLLSAVLSNADALASWIGIGPPDVIRGSWRPSAKRLLRWTESGKLQLHAGDDPFQNDPSKILAETLIPWPKKDFFQTNKIGALKKQEPLAFENIALLADYEYRQYGQPILCVSASKSGTRRLANEIARRFPPLRPIPHSIETIIRLIDTKYLYLRPLKEALERGVAYHNASLPQLVKEHIERSVEAKVLKVVTATTTLAEGVDLPFRVTILADWLFFDGQRNSPMESLLFKNIAGRCGRAGQFTEGDTIVFDNPVGDAQLTSPARRPELQARILFRRSEPVLGSAIRRTDKNIAVATLGSQLLAAIRENSTSEDLPQAFYEHSFVYQEEDRQTGENRIREAFRDILDDSEGYALAVAASPAKLTPLGEAAMVSGISPETARKIYKTVACLTKRGKLWPELVEIGSTLLKSLAEVPEQTNPDLRRINKKGSLPIVRPDELSLVLEKWVAGASLDAIFADLPSNQRSRRSPALELWLSGISGDSKWNDQFGKFSDFMNNCVEHFLPWILRASEPIAKFENSTEWPWLQWANFMEYGVDNDWAVSLASTGLVRDRKVACEIGHMLNQVAPGGDPTIQQVHSVLSERLEGDYRELNRIVGWFRLRENVR